MGGARCGDRKMISEMNASYVGLLTLMLDPRAPIYGQIQRESFSCFRRGSRSRNLSVAEARQSDKVLCFRSNHASNYVSLRGDLPQDKERMMAQLKRAMEDTGLLKDERFRML